ncbi:hypothetical protein MSG28_008895 [Choristoneura fumiferana]|uniref:Uncharacterized protein n=1 Tax=Choristoneura fumiferana TaxID=7141 RepID=A0ACC0J8D7_CHOFU|nr:hypothetical protein MSG28_008895 [Choristoneura fumiferana]
MDLKLSNSVANFAVKFYNELEKNKTTICSPLSVEIALAMLSLGCKNQSRAELMTALDVPDDDASVRGVTLTIANKIYVIKNSELKPQIQKDAEEVFESSVEQLDFTDSKAAANTINEWLLQMNYKGGDANMIIVLPDDIEGLNYVLQLLKDGYDLLADLAALKDTKLDVWIPKFKVETTIDLNKVLPKSHTNMRLENRSTDCNEVIKMRQVFNLIVKMWDTLKLFWSKTNRWHRVFFIFLIVQFRFIPGGQLGFQCNDPALSYPFTGDTINMKNEKPTDNSKSRALRWYREYLFGLLINLTLVQTLKLIVGSPRPHFFDTCQPEEALNCHECETCYYLHQRAKQSSASRVILSIQSVCLVAALYCCISRMTDHRHHWWDVLAGATVAAPIIWFTLLSLCKNFKCFESGDCEEPGQVKNSTNHKETCDIRG